MINYIYIAYFCPIRCGLLKISFLTHKVMCSQLFALSFEYINADTILCLYKSLIRPIIEYGNVIWGPHYVTDQQAIEKIQHRATKLIPELTSSYQERLSKLSLPSLVYRRQRGDLIFLYQLINQHFNIDINDFFRYQTYTTTRGHITTKSISHMQNASVV